MIYADLEIAGDHHLNVGIVCDERWPGSDWFADDAVSRARIQSGVGAHDKWNRADPWVAGRSRDYAD